MKRATKWIFTVLAFGILIYNMSVPWIRDYSISIYRALPNSGALLIEALLIQIAAIGVVAFLHKRRPQPYAWSAKTWINTRRKKKELNCSRKEAYRALKPEEKFPEVNVNFAALDIPYLRMLFIPLLFMSLPFLATIEELIFRNGKNTILSVLIFSMLFALAHVPSGFSVIDALLSFGVGMLFAAHYLIGGIGEAILLHTAINVSGVAILVWMKVVWPDVKPFFERLSLYKTANNSLENELRGAHQ
ncbi:MAG: CPBP family intramembrane glutamic endopeptidase [Candidatus Spechtbacterales bacterium]